MAQRWQIRRDTAAQWTLIDPILAAGEIAYETDTGKLKIGDGVTAWSSLSYFTTTSAPAGSTTQIQYNSSGTLAGDSGFTTNGSGSVNITGDLDVDNLNLNGNTIISTDTNGNIVLDPNGTGDVVLGNFTFDGDQTVGAGQDNYVLTYDNTTGKISLEASAGGGGEVVDDTTPQLGGDLDLNGNQITSPDGTDLIDIPNGSIDLQTASTSRLDITDSGVRLGAANARVTTILDEDTMSSDSATALATQQSIKAYVDNSIPSTGLVLVDSASASSTATVEFTGLSSTYFEYYLVMSDVTSTTTTGQSLKARVSTDNGSTWKSGASDYTWINWISGEDDTSITHESDDADDSFTISGNSSATTSPASDTNETYNATIKITSHAASNFTKISIDGTYYNQDGDLQHYRSSQVYKSTTAVNGFQIFWNSGNIVSGEFRLYGLRNA